jgi:methylated-DNA-[protein]-cysteine S-methyltransferase
MNKGQPIFYSQIDSTPAGALWVAVTDKGLYAVEFDKPEEAFLNILKRRSPGGVIQHDAERTAEACRQIIEYFQGQRAVFELEVDLSGLPGFQQEVMKATLAIPYGQTATYGEIAAAIGHPGAARAVGRAGATNPIPLVVPCHRVIGSDGKLHGYGGPGGISLKARLLEMERSNI